MRVTEFLTENFVIRNQDISHSNHHFYYFVKEDYYA